MESIPSFQAEYRDGILRPDRPLALEPGEKVAVIIVRRAQGSRWDLARIAATSAGVDAELAAGGLVDWAMALNLEDGSNREDGIDSEAEK